MERAERDGLMVRNDRSASHDAKVSGRGKARANGNARAPKSRESKAPQLGAVVKEVNARSNAVLTVSRVRAALIANDGNGAAAARELGVARQTLHEYVRRHKADLGETIEAIQFGMLQMARSVMRHHLDRNSFAAAQFVLDRLGKDDGWSSRKEVTGPGGKPAAVNVVLNQPPQGAKL